MSSLFTQKHLLYNASTRGNWEVSKAHRQQVTAFLQHYAPKHGGQLAVLGAGNLNDLDLQQLPRLFGRIDLIDLDPEALAYGLNAQGTLAAVVRSHAPVELTGVHDQLHAIQHQPTDEAFEHLLKAAVAPRSPLDSTRSVVASTCLMSQLFSTVVQALGGSHPRMPDVVSAVREGHLRLMAKMLAPGGVGVLVTDFVSSDSAPELISCPPHAWEDRLRSLIGQGNYFVGLNPMLVKQVLMDLAPSLNVDPQSVVCHPPWKWDLGSRVYAVTAYTFQKRATEPVA